jgi:hypothetical protein
VTSVTAAVMPRWARQTVEVWESSSDGPGCRRDSQVVVFDVHRHEVETAVWRVAAVSAADIVTDSTTAPVAAASVDVLADTQAAVAACKSSS